MKFVKQSLFALLLSFCLLNTQCDNDDDVVLLTGNGCDDYATVSDDAYNLESPLEFTLLNAEITGDCLSIEFSAVGCDNSSKNLYLYVSTEVAESMPVQRYVKAHFEDAGMCETEFEKVMSFDLLDLQLDAQNAMRINLEGWEEPLLYEY